ncbi:hypothetical protein ABD76_04205 [Paenibacillus dendritiformis]|nr:hypothetical protein [Paenibacillus dendritiformis]
MHSLPALPGGLSDALSASMCAIRKNRLIFKDAEPDFSELWDWAALDHKCSWTRLSAGSLLSILWLGLESYFNFSAHKGERHFNLPLGNIGPALHFLSPKDISIKQEEHEAKLGFQRSFSATATGAMHRHRAGYSQRDEFRKKKGRVSCMS